MVLIKNLFKKSWIRIPSRSKDSWTWDQNFRCLSVKSLSYQNYKLKLNYRVNRVFIRDCHLVIFDQSSCPNPLIAKIGQNLPKWRDGTRSINLNMILKMIFKSHLETHIMTSVVAFWIFDLQIFLKVSSHSRKFLIFF